MEGLAELAGVARQRDRMPDERQRYRSGLEHPAPRWLRPAASPAATATRNGPVPATTMRIPATTPCPFSNACTPPAVNTPGSVQPGKGSCRS